MKTQPFQVDIKNIDDSIIQPQRIDDLFGMFQTVSTAPTAVPNRLINQIQIYKSGATKRLYVYDTVNKEWDFVALT